NLNRYLPSYPPPDAAGFLDLGYVNPDGETNLVKFNRAQTARQTMAADILDALVYATTGFAPAGTVRAVDVALSTGANADAMRFLAQLAVNIVDYIDADDYSTPFNYTAQTDGIPKWVYGTELPTLLVNEVYAEMDNDPTDDASQDNPYSAKN